MATTTLDDWDTTPENLERSVKLSVRKYIETTGQSPQTYGKGVKNSELERLDLQHQLFHVTLRGQLYLSPIAGTPESVLDIATGDAAWVLDYAQRNASTTIVANDSEPMTLNDIPSNIIPQVGDANEPWTYSHQFDLIHCRQHHRRLEEHKLFEQGFKFLKPGGWIEMQELCNPVACDDSTLTEDNPLAKWGKLLVEASEKIKRPSNNPTFYEAWMKDAGFVNVRTVVHKWPTNPWPEDEADKLKGRWNLYNVLQRFDQFSTALLVKVLGWKEEDVGNFLKAVRAELHNPEVHAYWPVYIVYGQKPLSG